jgi:UDP-N-acetylmuramoyl-L-alanyl-D-glutamate--2,6-diaminopimelate ligase
MMRLSELISALPPGTLPAGTDPEITGVASDSRRIKPGELFVACTGGSADGHAFIPQAVSAGAAAVVGEREQPGLPVPYLRVPDARRALGLISAAWFGFPSRRMVLIGVTGTDGKTTTVNLIFSILKAAGLRAGMISTIGAVIGGLELDTGFHVTTPDAADLQEYLSRMAAAGLTHCVLEVTSHGLAQQRLAGCEFDVAAVTNITHEHLDYHGTFEAYRAVKAGLFAGLGATPAKKFFPSRMAVLNADDPSFDYLRGQTTAAVATYSRRQPADFTAADVRAAADGLKLVVHAANGDFPVQCGLAGAYNADNILAAWAVAVAGLNLSPDAAARGIASLEGIPGRSEKIDLGQEFLALVDFAHTPNALRAALESARALSGKRGRVIAVFGSAGLRDRGKRRQLAAAGIELADVTVLTAEDPRTESLTSILEEMAAGALSRGGVEGKTFFRIPDRGAALRFAAQAAQPGDVVIACGKGHEQSMCFGEVEYPWDDRRALRAALAGRLGVPGPDMPVLPTSEDVKEES